MNFLTREVDEATVRSAEMQNRWNKFANLGKGSAGLMSKASSFGLHPDSPAYDRLLNSLSESEESMRAQGRDPYRNADESSAAAMQAIGAGGYEDMVKAGAATRFNPYTSPTVRAAARAVGMDVPEAQPARSSRQPSRQIWNAGTVNGQTVMAPTPGNYDEVLAQRRRVGLNDPTNLDLGEYQRRQDEMAGTGIANEDMNYQQRAKAGRVQAEAAARAAQAERAQKALDAEIEHQRSIEIERTKAGSKADPREQAMNSFHAEQVKFWQEDQQKAAELEQLAASARNGFVLTRDGGKIPVSVIQAQVASLRRPRPTYTESLEAYGTPEGLARAEELRGGPQAEDPQAKMVKQQQVFSTLSPEERQVYQGLSQEQRDAYWSRLEQEGLL